MQNYPENIPKTSNVDEENHEKAMKKLEKSNVFHDPQAFHWPSDHIGERSSERVRAAKRAARFIACHRDDVHVFFFIFF